MHYDDRASSTDGNGQKSRECEIQWHPETKNENDEKRLYLVLSEAFKYLLKVYHESKQKVYF